MPQRPRRRRSMPKPKAVVCNSLQYDCLLTSSSLIFALERSLPAYWIILLPVGMHTVTKWGPPGIPGTPSWTLRRWRAEMLFRLVVAADGSRRYSHPKCLVIALLSFLQLTFAVVGAIEKQGQKVWSATPQTRVLQWKRIVLPPRRTSLGRRPINTKSYCGGIVVLSFLLCSQSLHDKLYSGPR